MMKSTVKNLTRAAVFAAIVLMSTQASAAVLYSLTAGTTFAEGCVPPCMCPVLITENVSGTFLLGDVQPDPADPFRRYPIEQIKWIVYDYSGDFLHEITGTGTYRVGAGSTPMHQLVLDLVIDGGEPEHLDSGLVAGGFQFPSISIDVSRGTECRDIWMTIEAAPTNIYYLGRGSTYSEGCVAPCMCPISLAAMRGWFTLTPSGSDWLYDYYDVEGIRWYVVAGSEISRRITGSGTYKIGGEFALTQRMELDLSIDGGTTMHLDSGEVVGAAGFPKKLAISLAEGAECFSHWVTLNAWMKWW